MRNYRNFIYNEERGFMFAYLPKVACTNWKAVMRYLAGHADYLNNRLAHDKVNGGLRYLDFTGPDLDLLSAPGIRKFTFIRNPYTRALSAYLNKVDGRLDKPFHPEDHWAIVTQAIDEFRKTQLDTAKYPRIDFEVFLLWLRDGKSHYRNDEHWQKQSVMLRWPTVQFDFIGRFESLQTDSKHLLGEMGCDIPFPSQQEVNFSPTEANKRLSNYLTDACADLIAQVYQDDFTNFHYPTEKGS